MSKGFQAVGWSLGGAGLVFLYAGLLNHYINTIDAHMTEIIMTSKALSFNTAQFTGSSAGFSVDTVHWMDVTEAYPMKFEQTAFVVMRMDISDTSLGLMISGLSLYLLGGLFFVVYVRNQCKVRALCFLMSSFVICFMYFVTKLSIDSLNAQSTSTRLKLCLYFPMALTFGGFVMTTIALFGIVNFGGENRRIALLAKALVMFGILSGCLFFPMGVVGLTNNGNFDVGFILLYTSLGIVVIGSITCIIGEVLTNKKQNTARRSIQDPGISMQEEISFEDSEMSMEEAYKHQE